MIRKYGEELGRKNVFIAVEKRKKTLLSRYGSTTFGGRASKASIYFFLPLYKQLRKLGITRADICWGIDGSREFATNYEGRNYFYDFTIKSLKYAIEYNGTYWHAREDLSWRRKDVTKDKSLEYDRNKCKAIEHRGFTLFTVWDDYDMIEQREKLFTEIQMLWKTIGQILK